jgi:nitroimidazol reductase NimA-like FMN-containing flavoprotein (pyridoxamine 5'-phosphate oxidase superfamily)
MVVHELTPSECRTLLARNTLGRLGCSQADQPYITPLFFYFDSDTDSLYGFATVGQKIEWMRANPKVCVELDDVTDQFHWTSVVVFGRYEELVSPDASPALERARDLFAQHPQWWLPGTATLATGHDHASPVMYRVRIDSVTGRRAARPERQ